MSRLIATLATLVAFASGAETTQRHFKRAEPQRHLRSTDAGASVSANKTHFDSQGSSASRPPSCIQNTGVSCDGKCDAIRGATECSNGKCVCSTGCSSSAGICIQQENVLVASGLRLQNARWPTYYLVASSMNDEIQVGDFQDPLARFNLYMLPGQGEHPQDFLLIPEGSPAHCVAVVHKYLCSDLMDQRSAKDEDKHNISLTGPMSLTGQKCTHSWDAQTQHMSPAFSAYPSVQETAVRLWQAPNAKDGAVTIRGAGDHVSKFLFSHEGSWRVRTRSDDPGLGGYWIPEPPLPFKFPVYDGPPCEHACPSLSVRNAVAGSGLLLALASALIA